MENMLKGVFIGWATCFMKTPSPSKPVYVNNKSRFLVGVRFFLYDLTNTYLEGAAAGNPEAKHAHSKQKRSDCPLVSLALAYNQDVSQLSHKVLAGNQKDAASIPDAVARFETDWKDLCAKDQRPLFVIDCGIGTAANLLLPRQKGYEYLVSERRSTRGDHEAIFAFQADF